MGRHTVWFRRKVEVCTDPQRRCYDGAFFSSEIVWSGWDSICTYSTKEIAESSAATFQGINKKDEYLVLPEGQKP